MCQIQWKNLKELIEDKAQKNVNKSFLLYEDHVFSYKDVDEISNAIANGLRSLGIEKGDNVLTYLFNCPEYIMTWFALLKLGAVMVSVNPTAKGDELKHYLRDAEAKAIILDRSLVETYRGAKEEVDIQREVVLENGVSSIPEDMIAFSVLRKYSTENLQTHLEMSDPATIIYTSGTTGKPKGVVLPHFYYINFGLHIAKLARLKPGDRFYSTFSTAHLAGQVTACISTLIADTDYVYVRRFSASKFWDQVKKYNCNIVHSVGSLPYLLYLQPEKPSDADNPVKIFLGSDMPKDLWERFERRFGVTVFESYATTELGVVSDPRQKTKVGTVGLPVEDKRVEIVNENDEKLPPFAHGEIVVRPEVPYTTMLGYYKNPEATWNACRNLWFHTGDIGYKDEEGYLCFVERKSHFLRRRGENISVEEVESIINQHPQVGESAVVGVPSEFGGEEVMACIVLKMADAVTPEEIVKWCEERMSYFKVPRYIKFLDILPRTPTLRIQRHKLKESPIGDVWDREKAGYQVKKV